MSDGVLGGPYIGEVREAAAFALGNLKEHGAAAVPALTKCLKDSDEDVRRVASEAVARSRGEAEAMAAEPRGLAAKSA